MKTSETLTNGTVETYLDAFDLVWVTRAFTKDRDIITENFHNTRGEAEKFHNTLVCEINSTQKLSKWILERLGKVNYVDSRFISDLAALAVKAAKMGN